MKYNVYQRKPRHVFQSHENTARVSAPSTRVRESTPIVSGARKASQLTRLFRLAEPTLPDLQLARDPFPDHF
jgi:hypothetical protein